MGMATSALALAREAALRTLANCAAARTFLGAATPEQALLRIHWDHLPRPTTAKVHTKTELAALRPFAVLYFLEPGYKQTALAQGGYFAESGRLRIHLCRTAAADAQNRPTPAELASFEEQVGLIADGLHELNGTADYLAFADLATDGPFQSEPEDEPAEGVSLSSFVDLDLGEGGA